MEDIKDVELNIIASIKNPADLSSLRISGLRRGDFLFHANLYDFYCKHIEKYESIPSSAVLKSEFPDLELPKIDYKSVAYFTDTIIREGIRRESRVILSRAIDILENDDPMKAIDYIGDRLFQLKRTRKISRNYTDKNALIRYDMYMLKRKEVIKGKPIGLRTGLDIFDEKMIGWNPGNFILLVGYKGVGKSFVAIEEGIISYRDKKRIVFVSPEMPVEEVELRWDSLMMRHDGVELNSEALIYGNKIDVEKYKEFLKRISFREDWVTLDSQDGRPFDIGSLESIADEYNPDLFIIDGLYLIRDEEGKVGEWSSMVTAANKLKTLATRKKIVILATSQCKDAEGRLAYAKYLSQPVDTLLWISEDLDKEDVRHITVQNMRSGKKPDKVAIVKFDPAKGIII